MITLNKIIYVKGFSKQNSKTHFMVIDYVYVFFSFKEQKAKQTKLNVTTDTEIRKSFDLVPALSQLPLSTVSASILGGGFVSCRQG